VAKRLNHGGRYTLSRQLPEEAVQVSVLATPRHGCTGCGACCQGAVVHLLDGEADAVELQAAALGVADPVVDGRLRAEGGRCVFLDEQRRCRIHARFGGDAKPLVCRQFPFVVIEVESAVRAGIDPATTAYATTRLDGPPLQPPSGVQPRPAHLPADQARVEAQLVALCNDPTTTLATLLAALCGAPDSPPPGFGGRWIATLQAAPLRELLHRPDVGPDHRAVLLPILDAVDSWDATAPPPWPTLARTEERLALDLVRDMLWLRLASRIPLVQAVALLTAAGALTAAWADPRPEAFGPALSMWCRLLRAGPFWQALAPSPAHLQALATGTG
jgi:Fe-S-cluster containining protein